MKRSIFAFVIIGLIGFIIDSSITLILINFGLSPIIARPPAIMAAMLFTWICNRTFTFRVEDNANISEASRYFIVAISAAFLNYLIYSLLITSNISPFISITIATGLITIISYLSYKHYAFKRKSPARSAYEGYNDNNRNT